VSTILLTTEIISAAGQNVGVKEIEEKIWLVSFMNHDLGFIDHESGRIECANA
jgi:hypothetical protein